MTITATDLKENLGYYFDMVQKEDLLITKNGKAIAQMTNPNKKRVEDVRSLFGMLPSDLDFDALKTERILN